MNITTKMKRGSCCSRAKHTDNIYGGPGRINVRAGKRWVRKALKNYLSKLD